MNNRLQEAFKNLQRGIEELEDASTQFLFADKELLSYEISKMIITLKIWRSKQKIKDLFE